MRKLKAQQITEFMLATPLLIIFFVVLTEFAFAFNSHLVFTSALKSSISAYINNIRVDSTDTDFQNAISNYVLTDMQNNRIPNLNTLETQLITTGENPVVVGSYTYNPDFHFAFLPALKNISMKTSSVFPIKKQSFSGYNNGISTDELNLIQPPAIEGAK